MQLRDQIDQLVASGDAAAASLRLAELWRQESGSATAAFVNSRYEQLRANKQFTPHRVAILRSFTLEPLTALLRASAFAADLDLTVHLCDFNSYPQEILDDHSSLYAANPDTAVLAVQTRDIAPELWSGFADLNADAVSASIERVVSSFRSWMAAFRRNSAASLIVHNLEAPPMPSLGILDAQSGSSQLAAIQQINQGLRAACRAHRGVYLLDYAGLIARHGYARWHDEKKWLTARLPISAGRLIYLAQEWLRFIVPLTGRTAKVLAVDLDNTLWGGIIGEDGMNGIRLGQEYPGAAYQALQRALLDLHRKGILLAICSKNNLDDALEALREHPGMLLKPDHFAAMRINWNDKAQSLRELAAELNLGIDALAFLDDNPVECAQIRSALPEVRVLELPSDPSLYAEIVRDSPFLERLAISEEDRTRTELYAAERKRSEAEQDFGTKEDFFRSLQQEAEVAPVDSSTLARVAQLTQKTNQFNLTTRRYSEQQVAEISARPGWQVLSLRVSDRFGDHGLVGVAIVHDDRDTREIDTFLLSCRVIGRNVETALLSYLAQTARGKGIQSLHGSFLPTKKNAPARNFYSQHGFVLLSANADGSTWRFDLSTSGIACPEWVKLRVLQERALQEKES